MKSLTCISLFLFVFMAHHMAWAHDETMPGGGPRSEQGEQHSQRPLVHPGRKLLHTEKGRLTGGGPPAAASGGPFPSLNIEFFSQLTLGDMGAVGNVKGNDIWGWTDPLDNREYALVGRSDGTAFVDVTDPVNPVYLGFLDSHTGNTAWRDIKVYADHAYIVSDNNGSHGLQVFDLTQLRSVALPPISFSETTHYAGFAEGHNIAINEATGIAYVVGSETFSGGLHFIDITNPTNPVAAGGFSADGYTHDTQVVTYAGLDTAYSDREIAFNCNEDTLTIVDVTDKNMPVQLSRTGYPKDAYTHQGWLTEDHAWFLSNDELDERNNASINFTRTHIWDVADLDAPVYFGFYEASVQSIDHNLYVHNGLVYAANYTTGLRVLDYADIANGNLTEVAYIDTHPGKDSLTSFDGAWSSYPYFASGTVIIGDRDEGLIVVRVLKPDQDGDGLDDYFETAIGTDPLLPDTDGDAVTDYDEVAFDGDVSAYNPGQDLDPLSSDTDSDGHGDASDPLPLVFNFDDGDLAPLGTPDGMINAADYLIGARIVLGEVPATDLERSHGDLYPQGAPDGIINLSDLLLLLQLVLQGTP